MKRHKPSTTILTTRHQIHTSSIINNNKDNEDDEDNEIQEHTPHILPSLPFMWSYMLLRTFTSLEFVVHDFLEGALEAFHFVLGNLAAGNVDDIEETLTERGATSCRNLLLDMRSAQMAIERDEVRLMNPRRLKTATGDDDDGARLTVVVGFLCSAPGEGGEAGFNPERYFELTMLTSYDEDGSQTSDWVVDNITFKKNGN